MRGQQTHLESRQKSRTRFLFLPRQDSPLGPPWESAQARNCLPAGNSQSAQPKGPPLECFSMCLLVKRSGYKDPRTLQPEPGSRDGSHRRAARRSFCRGWCEHSIEAVFLVQFFPSYGEHKLRDAGTPPIFCLVLLLTLWCLGTIPSALLKAPPFGAENQEQDSEGRAWKCSSLRIPLSSSAQLLLP